MRKISQYRVKEAIVPFLGLIFCQTCLAVVRPAIEGKISRHYIYIFSVSDFCPMWVILTWNTNIYIQNIHTDSFASVSDSFPGNKKLKSYFVSKGDCFYTFAELLKHVKPMHPSVNVSLDA